MAMCCYVLHAPASVCGRNASNNYTNGENMAKRKDKPVAYCLVPVSVPGIARFKARQADDKLVPRRGKQKEKEPLTMQHMFNVAWGFKDGNCNRVTKDGRIVAKTPVPPGFEESAYAMYPSTQMMVQVALYKDGRMEYTLHTERKAK